jgi:hypothetical protein
MAKTVSIIHILVSGKAAKDRLPASEVTTEPRNWSITRRSKSSLSAPSFDSPAGFVMMGASMRE